MNKEYNANSISIAEGLEGVRENISLYVGKPGDNSILHLLKEVVENSIDEYMIKENSYVGVKVEQVSKEQTFYIIDYGRGIPVDKHEKTGNPALIEILTKLHAGAKGESCDYGGASRGRHGLGLSVVNALSKKFEIWTYRDNKWSYLKYKKGKQRTKLIKKKPPNNLKDIKLKNKGTIIKYTPDYSLLGKDLKVSNDTLKSWLKNIAYLNKNLKIQLITDDIKENYFNKKGPIEYLDYIIKSKGDIDSIGKPFIFESENLTVALKWTDFDDDNGIISYVNSALSERGGTHIQGLFTTISKVFKSESKKSKWSTQDIKYGILGYINYKLSNAQFSSQTKEELVTVTAKKDVINQLSDSLTNWVKSNKITFKKIINRANDLNKVREKGKDQRKAAGRFNKESKSKLLLPGKLAPCDKKTPYHLRELYIVEGSSAAGTAKQARDRKFQMVLGLKGKIINIIKNGKLKALTNPEIQDIILSIGLDIKDLNKSKEFHVGKIILLLDEDYDGKHIGSLAGSLLHVLLPEMYLQNKVYIVDAPLYFATTKNKKYYGNSLKEINKKIKNEKAMITRMKGWGEAPAKILKEIAFDVNKRKLILLESNNVEDENNFIQELMGKDSSYRKKLLGVT